MDTKLEYDTQSKVSQHQSLIKKKCSNSTGFDKITIVIIFLSHILNSSDFQPQPSKLLTIFITQKRKKKRKRKKLQALSDIKFIDITY
jgi:uncharacterized protein YjiS (DUF1127 family)